MMCRSEGGGSLVRKINYQTTKHSPYSSPPPLSLGVTLQIKLELSRRREKAK